MTATNHLLAEDVNWVLARTPKDVRELLQANPDKVFLAGGWIRDIVAGEKPSDIDLFAATPDLAKAVAQDLALKRQARLIVTENASTIDARGRKPVQVIHRWVYETAQDLVLDFDWSVCSAAIWWEPAANEHTPGGWRSQCHARFYADLAAKRLVYLVPKRNEEAGGSVLRLTKFMRRGYRARHQELAAVITRLCLGVHEIGHAFPEAHGEAQLRGTLTGLLRKVDPLIAIDGEVIDTSEFTER